MANLFDTTRTPGSRSSSYDLVAHIADSDPHPQYLLKSDYQGGGGSESQDLQIHKSDPNAHGDNYIKPAALNDYYRKTEIDQNIYTKTEVDELLQGLTESGITLYHDPTTDSSESHAASMKAANVVYNLITEHTKRYSQTDATGHLDVDGAELYAHRKHTHQFTDLSGVAAAGHNHDNTYSSINHTHDDRYAFTTHSHNYLSATELEMYGLYRTVADVVSDEYDFNEETTFGNYAIPASVFSIALNKPNINSTTKTLFLSVLVNNVTEDSEGTYGEKNCSQTLTTEYGVLYRLGHSAGGNSEIWTFTDWNWVCNGNKNVFEIFYSASTTPPPGAFPLWTGAWIRDCATLYPDFYQKAIEYRSAGSIRVIDNGSYDNEVYKYGQCGAFVISGNDIRLPKILYYVRGCGTSSEIGRSLSAGLPNITGDFSRGSSFYGYNNGSYTGAFRWKSDETVYTLENSTHREQYPTGWTFDASRCSSVYGSSNTVQPPSVQLALYIQVYNTVVLPAISTTGATTYTLTNNSVKFSKTMFTKDSWVENSDGDYVCTLLIESEPILHVYKTESNVATIVDTSVEIRSSNNGEQATIQLVSSTAFDGYITILEV